MGAEDRTDAGEERGGDGVEEGSPAAEERAEPESAASGRSLSRRQLIKSAGAAGAAAFLPRVEGLAAKHPTAPSPASGPRDRAEDTERGGNRASSPAAAVPDGALHNLTAREAELLDAVVARLIPADEHGPGAREAGALRYIDRALGGVLSDVRAAYRTGLAALDRYARYSRGAPFDELSPSDQDSVLFDLQGGGATGAGVGFEGSSASFFYMVRSHTLEAMFGDPSYGGNADFAGWKLLEYPGLRRAVGPETQRRLEAGELEIRYHSAYDPDER